MFYVCKKHGWKKYQIPEFNSSFNSVKRGKGIATFCKQNNEIKELKHINFQISKIIAEQCDIISIYRSQDEKDEIKQFL